MTPPTMSAALAAEHIRDLHRVAAQHRLVVLDRRDRPSGWDRLTARVGTMVAGARTWVSRGQLGPTSNYCAAC